MDRAFRRTPWLAVGLWLISVAGLWGADPTWKPVFFEAEPAALLAASQERPAPEGYDSEVLYYEREIKLDKEGRATITNRQVVRILTEEGIEDWSTISVDWAPWRQERPKLRGRVTTADGQAHLLTADAITEGGAEQEPQLLNDRLRIHAALPAVALHCVIESESVLVETRPLFAAGVSGNLSCDFFEGIRLARLRLVVPVDLPHFRHSVRGGDLKPRVTERDGNRVFEIELSDVKPETYFEPGMPLDTPPWLELSYSTGESWGAIARSYAAEVDKVLADTESLASTARSVVAGETDRRKIVEKLFAFVQSRVRYTGLEFGQSSLLPATPATTLQRRYGDCKDQSTLLVGLLRTMGVTAHLALLNSGFSFDLDRDSPGMGNLNHAIVYIPGETPLWVDPTASLLRVGEIPVENQGRWALVADKESTDLLRIPHNSTRDNRLTESRSYVLRDLEPALIEEETTYAGVLERHQRQNFSGEAKVIRDSLRRYANETYVATEVSPIEWTPPADLSRPFRTKLSVQNSGTSVTAAQDAVVLLNANGLFEFLPRSLRIATEEPAGEEPAAPKKKRKYPLYLRYPYAAEMVSRIQAPLGFEIGEIPQDVSFKLGPASLSQSVQRVSDREVVLTYALSTGDRHFTPEEVEAAQEQLRKLAADPESLGWCTPIKFVHVASRHAAEGRWREAIAEYQRLRAQEPKCWPVRLRLAETLVALGLQEIGLAELEQAFTHAPDHVALLNSRTFILSHDRIGEELSSSIDRPKLEAAARDAFTKNPKSVKSRRNLAMVLTLGKRSHQFSGQLDEAIALYREGLESHGQHDFDLDLALCLFRSEKYAELLKLRTKLQDRPEQQNLSLAIKAIQTSADAAIRFADREYGEESASMLLQTADQLNANRQYKLSARFIRAGLDRLPGKTPIQVKNLGQLASNLEKTKRWEEIVLPADNPGRVVQDALRLVLIEQTDEAGFRELFAVPESALNNLPKRFQRLRLVLREAQRVFRSVQHSEARIADVVSNFQQSVEPTATATRIGLPGIAGDFAFYLAKQPAGWRIVGASSEIDWLYLQADAAAERGDWPAAKQWLDWIWKEEIPNLDAGDRFRGPPFLRLWTPGQEVDESDYRLALAGLQAFHGDVDAALKTLRACPKDAPEGVRLAADRSILYALDRAERADELLVATDNLLEKTPHAKELLFLKSKALRRLDRLPDLWKLAEERLKSRPTDFWGLMWRSEMLARERKWSEFDQLDAKHKLVGGMSGNLSAWRSLFRDQLPPDALKVAQEAVQSSPIESVAAHLHTLATVEAELGMIDEARDHLAESIRIKGEILNFDWYVMGRIAEHLGLPDAARIYYQRVNPITPEETRLEAFPTAELAQRRLKQLPSP